MIEYIAIEDFCEVDKQIRDSFSYIQAPLKKRGGIGNRILKSQLNIIRIKCVDHRKRTFIFVKYNEKQTTNSVNW